jgi:hypothetical protein
MSRRLAESLATHGRAATLLLAAALAGGVGGAWAVAGAPGLDQVTVHTVADETSAPESAESTARPTDSGRPTDAGKPSPAGKASKSAKPDKPDKPDKAAQSPGGDTTASAQGAHGACVSAVARSAATGGVRDNHGGAVSAAAHDCPKPSPASTDD